MRATTVAMILWYNDNVIVIVMTAHGRGLCDDVVVRPHVGGCSCVIGTTTMMTMTLCWVVIIVTVRHTMPSNEPWP